MKITTAIAALVTASFAAGAFGAGHALPELQPFTSGPAKLKPGAYRTGDDFTPTTTFRVGTGWYGNQGSSTDWFAGKGFDRIEQRFTYAGIYIDALALPYAKAVAKFRGLRTLVAGPGTPTRVGGYAGVTFNAKVKGEHAPLTALGTGADIPGDLSGQQTFVNVRGTTLLIRAELGKATAAKSETRMVIRSFRFPRS